MLFTDSFEPKIFRVIACILEIHSKDLVAVLHLLVTLARYFRAPIRFPNNVTVPVIIVKVITSFH